MEHFYIFNANAGNHDSVEVDNIQRIVSQKNGKVFVAENRQGLEKLLREYQDCRPRIFGIGGGDGTIGETLTAVRDIWGYVPETLALFPTGTICTYAADFSLHSGIRDRWKRRILGRESKNVEYARYLTDALQPQTMDWGLLNVNGRLAICSCPGTSPKLVFLYYGGTKEKYRRLQNDVRSASPSRREEIVTELERTKAGRFAASMTTINSIIEGLTNGNFFGEHIRGDLTADGTRVEPSWAYFCSSFEKARAGLTATVNYGARDHPQTVQVEIPRIPPGKVARQAWKNFLHIKPRGLDYLQVKGELPRVSPTGSTRGVTTWKPTEA